MPASTSPLLDSFTRADEDPLAGSWLGPIFTTDGQLKIVGGVAVGRNTVACASYWKNAFPARQEVWVTLRQKWTGNDNGLALFVNLTAPNSGSVSGYVFTVYTSTALSQDVLDVYRIDAGSFTQLGATVALGVGGLASGDRYWLASDGGVLTFYRLVAGAWTVLASRSDATYGAGFIGIAADNDTLSQDDFGGGAIGHAAYQPLAGARPAPFSPGNPNFPLRF